MQHVYTGVTVCHRVGCWNPNAEVILLHLKIIANKTGNWTQCQVNPKNTLNTLYTSKSCSQIHQIFDNCTQVIFVDKQHG
jgi:hypothetical protein